MTHTKSLSNEENLEKEIQILKQQIIQYQNEIESLYKIKIQSQTQTKRIESLEKFIVQTATEQNINSLLYKGVKLLIDLFDLDFIFVYTTNNNNLVLEHAWTSFNNFINHTSDRENSIPYSIAHLFKNFLEQIHIQLMFFEKEHNHIAITYALATSQQLGIEQEISDYDSLSLVAINISGKNTKLQSAILAGKLDYTAALQHDKALSSESKPLLIIIRNLLQAAIERIEFIQHIREAAQKEEELLKAKREEERKTILNLVSIAAEISDSLNSPLLVISNVLERIKKQGNTTTLDTHISLALSSINKTQEFLSKLRDATTEIETTQILTQTPEEPSKLQQLLQKN